MKEFEYLGTKISECRQNKNMTQEEMARRLAVTPQALSKWERGQSYSDISLLADICKVLEISADYLLGIEEYRSIEKSNDKIQEEVYFNLRNCLEPLELHFGEDLIPIFSEKAFREMVIELRKKLAREGILIPIIRIADNLSLKSNEFTVLSYRKVLYCEELERIDENTLKYMIYVMGKVVKDKYVYIISPDIIKNLTDNLKLTYPVLIENIVPEKISYGLLTDVMREFLKRKKSMIYFPKVIEILESVLRQNSNLIIEELAEEVIKRL